MADEPRIDDPHRPRYHVLPPRNWMNDPNGLIHYRGIYHLFYQYNPHGALWGSISWGHAASRDLVHWTHMPLALTPDPNGADRDGCYSGAMVVHDDVPTIVYTGVRRPHERPCVATSRDPDLATWTKNPRNPVVPATPTGVATTIFRDHTLWREDGAWMMGVGSGIEGRGGAVLLFRSPDLVTWEYLHPLAEEDASLNPGGVLVSRGWECPDFFFIDGAPVLVACDWDGDPISVSYWTGEYANQRFRAHARGTVDAGGSFYAPQTLRDASGRRIMFGWLREGRSDEAILEAGWAGVMSLPRVVSFRDNGSLAFTPAPEVHTLRGRHIGSELVDGDVPLRGLEGDSCEIVLRVHGRPEASVGVEVLRSPDGTERTQVLLDAGARNVILDTSCSSRDARTRGDRIVVPLTQDDNGDIELRVFVDRSVVEVFTSDGTAVSSRAYPISEVHDGIRLVNPGNAAARLDVWEMSPGNC